MRHSVAPPPHFDMSYSSEQGLLTSDKGAHEQRQERATGRWRSRWCPAACGKAQCALTAGRWLALFSRKHPDICAAILDENCDGFCAKQCPKRFMPAEPTPAAIATPLPSPAARLLGKMPATTMQEAEDAARRAPS